MKLNIILVCLILLSMFLDALSYMQGEPCHYRWLFRAEALNLALCIALIVRDIKLQHLKEK